ncbi:MAG: MtrAB system histidine kinase MtrB [Mycobacteriaceae bacterium]
MTGDTVRVLRRVARSVARAFAHWWRRSLQLRVVTSTLVLSSIVVLALGFVLLSQVTARLLDAKVNAATEEVERARSTVQRELAGADESNSLRSRLNSAGSALTSAGMNLPGSSSSEAGAFEPVLIVRGDGPRGAVTSGPVGEIPTTLRPFVQAGQLAYQYTSVAGLPALVVGTPAPSDVAGLELYLVFPLSSEERNISLIQGTVAVGGAVLLLLLAGIAALVARQVVLPVRTAVDVAERFAEGHLEERMSVRGEDDVARLGLAFNDMAASLAQQIAQLEEFGALQRRFTSDVSHELRTPLTTVRMAADVLHAGSEDMNPALRRSAELLVAELDRFETLLADLLEISRHDAGMAELADEPLDARLCVRAAVETVRNLAAQSGSELVLDLPDERILLEADARRVERILRNLLANALDHGEGKPVYVQLRASEGAVAITVRDTGVGLRPGEDELVFNRFWRSDPSRVRRSGGTGLGLAISLEDAHLHGGWLDAWGRPGVGACFRLTLPLRRGGTLIESPLPLAPDAVAVAAQ